MEAALHNIKDYVATADENGRQEVLEALRNLTLTLETPHDALQRFSALHLQTAVVRAAIDMRLFNILAASKVPMSVDKIAQEARSASLLTARLLRYLASFGMVSEAGKNTFSATEKTIAYSNPGYQGGVCHYFETVGPTYQNIPAYLAEMKYQDVTDNTKTAFNRAWQTDLPGFVWFQTKPRHFAWFNQYMTIQRGDLPDWLSVFSVETECSGWSKGDQGALLVDVGGGFGHQSLAFRKKYPSLPGRVILQDLPQALDAGPKDPSIEKMAHNFFEPQPVKGAKFYYLRNILHDYPDHQACVILRNIISAMDANSAILIDEMVLPDQGVPLTAAGQDLAMMFALASIERTKEQWYHLLDTAGLETRDMYRYTVGLNDSVIVALPKAKASN